MREPTPSPRSYTPAAGYHILTPLYDFGLAVTTREHVWRDRLVHHMALTKGEVILDIGSGTGNLALAIGRHSQGVRYFGIDPDEAATQLPGQRPRSLLRRRNFSSVSSRRRPSRTGQHRRRSRSASSCTRWGSQKRRACCARLGTS